MDMRVFYCTMLFALLTVIFGIQASWPVGVAAQEVMIDGVDVRVSPQGPVVLLKVGARAIPVFVDPTVAGSIHSALSGENFSRPLSHDLMKSILSSYHITVQRVFVTLRDGIYYGTLTMLHDGQIQLFDSRSSDAIALAIHFQSPIVVEQDLIDAVGIDLTSEPLKDSGLEL